TGGASAEAGAAAGAACGSLDAPPDARGVGGIGEATGSGAGDAAGVAWTPGPVGTTRVTTLAPAPTATSPAIAPIAKAERRLRRGRNVCWCVVAMARVVDSVASTRTRTPLSDLGCDDGFSTFSPDGGTAGSFPNENAPR